MVGFGNPENISNLSFWLDASDSSTINDGIVSPNQTVTKIVDKVGGYGLIKTAALNWIGPTYAVSAVNGNNAISFTNFVGLTGDPSRKVLVNSGVPTLNSQEKTLVFVHRPVISTQNTKYALGIWGLGRSPGLGQFPSIYVLNGSGVNPYTQYGEVPGTGGGVGNIYEWNHISYEQGVRTNSALDASATQIMIVRTKSGVNKFNFYQDRGFNSKTLYFSGDSSLSQGLSILPTNPKIVLGAYHDSTIDLQTSRPFEGFFCEMMYFNRYLRTTEVNNLEQFLKMKWIG